MITQISKSTFKTKLPCGEKVEIGNIDSADFKPHLKLNRWDGECFIKLGLPVIEKSLPIIDGDKIIWEGTDRHIEMYPFASKQFSLGAYEYEVVLDKKPLSNKIILDFNTQGLRLCYQPPLTQEELEEGCFRPDNVVGSYAVCHATKGGLVNSRGKNYKAGEAFLIPRPKIFDARGDWAWEDQFIDPITGKQIITIPQEFLEYAHYPIRHAAGDTFGFTDKGATGIGVANYRYAGQYTCPEAGTGDDIRIYYYNSGGDSANADAYLYTGNSKVANGATGELAVAAAFDNWKTFAFGTPPTLANQAYNLTGWYGDADLRMYYNSDAAYTRAYAADTYDGNWPDAGGYSTATGRKLSAYCIYTPAAPPAGIGAISQLLNPFGLNILDTGGR